MQRKERIARKRHSGIYGLNWKHSQLNSDADCDIFYDAENVVDEVISVLVNFLQLNDRKA